jgi:DNA-binding XRE family transcriptional regulator
MYDLQEVNKLSKLRISLAAARVNAEMTQEDVAREMHVSKNTVVNWEKGKSEPTISQSRELSKLYNMPLEYIFYLNNQIKFDFANREREVSKVRLRKIIGWILVFTPAALIEAISILPNAIGMMILIFLLFLGVFTIVRKGLHLIATSTNRTT